MQEKNIYGVLERMALRKEQYPETFLNKHIYELTFQHRWIRNLTIENYVNKKLKIFRNLSREKSYSGFVTGQKKYKIMTFFFEFSCIEQRYVCRFSGNKNLYLPIHKKDSEFYKSIKHADIYRIAKRFEKSQNRKPIAQSYEKKLTKLNIFS